MLVLSTIEGGKVHIGDDIIITLVKAANGKARIGFEAPDDVKILRDSVKKRDDELKNAQANNSGDRDDGNSIGQRMQGLRTQ